ncbi:MAG: hypothetical protein IT280_06165 [Ignavibacteria bacterium]|nr:hypothetical protein [Ignavibacteria bacterium]
MQKKIIYTEATGWAYFWTLVILFIPIVNIFCWWIPITLMRREIDRPPRF